MTHTDVNNLTASKPIGTSRLLGLIYGFGNQLLFLVTVWYLFWFLRDGTVTHAVGNWLIRDTVLAIFFAVVHSIMLYPISRKYLSRWIPGPFYDSTFCVATCLSLLVLFFGWQNSRVVLWELEGWGATLVRVCFYASWLGLFYSLWLTGLGYQNGWTPFYYWMIRVKAPRREFKPRGAYKKIRHPVYLSFLGLIWFIPQMSLDHFALCAVWTIYIFVGSYLKDLRLSKFIGRPYHEYMESVPGFLTGTGGLKRIFRRHHADQAPQSSPNVPDGYTSQPANG